VITRALGLETQGNRPDVRTEAVAVGDTFLLCTDGLTDVLDDEAIAALMNADDLRVACDRMVHEAYENGSRDNITVVTLRRVA
jgi:protein phosphatase